MKQIIQPFRRFNRNSTYQTVFLPLGKDKFNGGTVMFPERMSFGVTIIGANARFGKSITVKNLYTQIGQFRPVFILDYLGEHSYSKWPNFLSSDRNTRCLPELKEIRGFKFKISQFSNESDWLSLQFQDRGALLMAQLARQYRAHRDDPSIFRQMLEEVPKSGQWGADAKFQARWGFELTNVNSSTLESCRTLFQYLYNSNFFAQATDATYDFGTLALQHHYLNINFALDKAEIHKARALAGKVLEQLKKVIEQFEIPPLIVVEEADVIAPRSSDSPYMISSVVLLVEFVLKLQKKKIELMFIVQDLKNLHSSIVGNYHTMILGQLPPNNEEYFSITKHLSWDIDKNYREFALLIKGVPGFQVFIPEDSMTMY